MRKFIVVTFLTVAFACSREVVAPSKPAAKASPKSGTETAPAAAAEPAGASVGSMMPAYTASSLDGKKFDIAAEHGSVVLLNVWATWCGPCRYEIPALGKIHQKYAKRGFKVVGVSIDEGDAEPVKKFVTDHEMQYPIVLDPDGRLADLFQTSVIPTSVVIDRNGKIVWKKYGAIEEGDQELTKAIEAALSATSS